MSECAQYRYCTILHNSTAVTKHLQATTQLGHQSKIYLYAQIDDRWQGRLVEGICDTASRRQHRVLPTIRFRHVLREEDLQIRLIVQLVRRQQIVDIGEHHSVSGTLQTDGYTQLGRRVIVDASEGGTMVDSMATRQCDNLPQVYVE